MRRQSPGEESDTPVNYVCDWNATLTNWFGTYLWHQRETVKLNVAVNASSGEFMRVEK